MANEFKITSIDQLLAIMDQGNFYSEVMDGHRDLMAALVDHQAEFGGKPKAKMVLEIEYQRQKSGDVQLAGKVTFTPPKSPPAMGAAYIGPDLELTLESPMLSKMRGGVRDTTTADEKEIRAAK